MGFWKYVLSGLKGWAISLVTALVFVLPIMLINFITKARPFAGFIVMLCLLPLELAVWGWFAKKWFGWK